MRSLFSLSARECRGILWLLPLLAVVAALIAYANRPSFEKSFLQPATGDDARLSSGNHSYLQAAPADTAEAELFEFDPNTVTLQELCRLGFTTKTAAGIIKYRERGKRFEIPEDFATCYGVGIDHYTRLEPYIIIGDKFRVRRGGRSDGSRVSPDAKGGRKGIAAPAAPFDPNELDADGFRALGFSERQAQAIINYRNSMGGFRAAEDLSRCFVVSEEAFARLEPFIEIKAAENAATTAKPSTAKTPVELNTADSAALRSVSGIGEVLVGRIMEYRRRLGGFVRVEQLAEVQGMSEANYERICAQIWIDTLVIQKIDINFATHKNIVDRLGNHPYATDKIIRKLLKERQLKGGWSSIEDMVESHIMTRKEAEKLAPYLIFRQQ